MTCVRCGQPIPPGGRIVDGVCVRCRLSEPVDLSKLPPPPVDGRHYRAVRRALTIVMGLWAGGLVFSLWSVHRIGELRAELATERDRNPCTLVAMTMGGVALHLRQAPTDIDRLRVAGAAAVVLHPVISKCSGTDTSALAQRFTEGRTLDEQLAALDELRALVQP